MPELSFATCFPIDEGDDGTIAKIEDTPEFRRRQIRLLTESCQLHVVRIKQWIKFYGISEESPRAFDGFQQNQTPAMNRSERPTVSLPKPVHGSRRRDLRGAGVTFSLRAGRTRCSACRFYVFYSARPRGTALLVPIGEFKDVVQGQGPIWMLARLASICQNQFQWSGHSALHLFTLGHWGHFETSGSFVMQQKLPVAGKILTQDNLYPIPQFPRSGLQLRFVPWTHCLLPIDFLRFLGSATHCALHR